MAYEPEIKELKYDLRQTYAEIIDEVLKRLADARINKRYIDWFNALDDLHVEIHQKLKPDERNEYKTKLNETIKELNANSNAYQGKDRTPEKIYKIQIALKELEMWLKIKMEKHKMFGAKEDAELL